MFLCVSPNPAIDKRLTLPSLSRGHVNRLQSVRGFPGGKSAHVAMVLQTLGGKPHWIGPCGGAAGNELVAGLSALGIQVTAHPAQETTRTNLEIVEDDGTVTEILEPGGASSPAGWSEFEKLCGTLFSQAASKAFVIFSGSLPAGSAPDRFARLISIAQESGCKTFVDTSGEPLRHALIAKPYFVKPNREELTRLLAIPIDSVAAAAEALRKLLELGAHSAALSLGADGLLFCPAVDAPIFFAPSVTVQARSTVGCGDSALAGFAFGIASNHSPEATLRLATACAAANCLAASPGAARLTDIQALQQKISVQTLSASP